ncbi:hypothetical protein DBY21_05395 [Candidatus Gastranaerophilales bacterium]|uniref:Uncharacterized protein n=1 Tax=Candidatus Scatenecus faecavium TaxID=2840915 RepID=A0A9D1FUK6_9BACT|nr:MAG: hypothetical protein DBY21_05395 [Candidatus Gastranaerophilales bacterium]HIS82472.1 hypothetical protein [Candidatus Scatenecus faecavium]
MQVTFDRQINSPRPVRHNSVNRTQKALTTTSAWFAFGVGLDCVGRKCTVFKSPTKNSIFINSIISSGAGLFAYFSKNNK